MDQAARQRAIGIGLGRLFGHAARVTPRRLRPDAALLRLRAAALLLRWPDALAPTPRRRIPRAAPQLVPIQTSTWLRRPSIARIASVSAPRVPRATPAVAASRSVARLASPWARVPASPAIATAHMPAPAHPAAAPAAAPSAANIRAAPLVPLAAMRPRHAAAPAAAAQRLRPVPAGVLRRLPQLFRLPPAPACAGLAPAGMAPRLAPARAVAPIEPATAPAPAQAATPAAVGAAALPGTGPSLRWLTDQLADAAIRPPSGMSGLDDRISPVFPGMVGPG